MGAALSRSSRHKYPRSFGQNKQQASLSTSHPRMTAPRRFAPLNPDTKTQDVPKKLDGIVFDVDGTLCLPQNYMFAEMRAALGIQKPTDILDHVYSLPSPQEQEEAMEKIRAIERKAMHDQKAQAGLVELMDYLQRRGIRKAICTRNFDAPVNHLLETFLPGHVFEPIM